MQKEERKIYPHTNWNETKVKSTIGVGVNCPIFQKQEPVIKDITDKINKAKNVQGKAKFAEELQKEVNVLLSCSEHKKESLDCKNCHFIANLRKKTADLIIKAKKLA